MSEVIYAECARGHAHVLNAFYTARSKQLERGCSQQGLQYAQNGAPVQWVNGPTTYVMTPAALFREGDRQCRNFVMTVHSGDRQWRENRRACRGPGASWYVDN